MGGQTAVRYAKRHPDKVAGLCLVAAAAAKTAATDYLTFRDRPPARRR